MFFFTQPACYVNLLPGHPDPWTRKAFDLPHFTPVRHVQPVRHGGDLCSQAAPEVSLGGENIVPLPDHPGWGETLVGVEEPEQTSYLSLTLQMASV